MTFTFLNTADWQIGKAFGGLPKDVAAALTDARLAAIDRLADVAHAAGARHVLVAGDVFDSEAPAPKTVRQALARMTRHGELTWHLLPGNHDAHRPGGLWERMVLDDLPANIRPHLTPLPVEIAPGVWLLPAPLTGRAVSTDPTAHLDTAATPAGALRIGLAHGSVRGFGSDGDAPVLISRSRAQSARLDYLALGDWHGALRIDERTWYAGTPEPDRFLGNDAGHALIVRIAGPGKPPGVEKVRMAQFVWLRMEHVVSGADSLSALETLIAKAADRPSDVLLQLELTGCVSATERQEVLRRLRTIEAGLRHLETDMARLSVKASSADLDALGAMGELRLVGERLSQLTEDSAAPEALSLLFDLAAETHSVRA